MKLQENSFRTNGLTRPVVDTVPQFSWKLTADKNGEKQDAYRILVSKNSDLSAPVWDTDFVTSEDTVNIRYAGAPLSPVTRYYIRLTVKAGADTLTADDYFDTGKMGERFRGIWITGHDCVKRDEVLAAPELRREFSVKKALRRAMLYIAGLGYFEARIDGKKVGDDYLSTAYTAYDKHILYRAFDVTDMVCKGENAIGVILGGGFYNCFTIDPWQTATAPWRDVPKMLLDLQLDYADGTSEVIASDLGHWKSHAGPITFNGIRHGESYDARLETDGWDMPHFDDADWQTPCRPKSPGALLYVMEMEPIRVRYRFPAVSKKKVPEGWLFDIGQNQAGVCQLTFRGKRGDKITVRYCDRLTDDGRLDQEPLACFIKNYCFQTDTYIKRTDEPETWNARFTYHGYQWVEISGSREEPQLSDVMALALCNDLEARGEFDTSSAVVNRIQHMCYYTTTSCLMNTFVSDAVREKSSWTGDTGCSVEQLLLNFGAEQLMKKWQQDLRDAQRPGGCLPCIVPSPGWGYNSLNGPDWSFPMVNVPWHLYMASGDLSVLADNYDALCRHVAYIDSMAEGEIASFGLGDWCAPFEGAAISVNMESFKCPIPVTDTAFYYSTVRMAAVCADLLGFAADADAYAKKAEGIKAAFRAHFYDAETHTVAGNCQTATAVMIYHGLANEEEIPALVEKLEEQIAACGGHLDFGVLGAAAVLNVLGTYGRVKTALKIITNPTYPSYAHWLTLGANTLWECWNGGGSRNHHMFSDVSAFFYKYIGGISAAAPGYKKILLRPAIDAGIDRVHASVDTPHGTVRCDFRHENDGVMLEIEVPVGTEATLLLPDREPQTLVCGSYRMTV